MVDITPGPWEARTLGRNGVQVISAATIAWCGVSSSYGDQVQHVNFENCIANAAVITQIPGMLHLIRDIANGKGVKSDHQEEAERILKTIKQSIKSMEGR
jgi:hypothetical protein